MNFYYHGFILAALITTCSLKSGGGGRGGGGGGGGSGGRSGGSSGSSGSRSSGGGGFSGSGRSSSSMGSSKSSGILKSGTSRTIAAGLAGAAVGYVGAKMTSKIARGVGYMFLPNYGRNYYYGNRNYQGMTPGDKQVCRYYIEQDDEVFDLRYDDDSRVPEIVYECNARDEECCDGLDCCKRQPLAWWAILLIVLAVFLFLLLLVAICIKVSKRSRNTTQPKTFATGDQVYPQTQQYPYKNDTSAPDVYYVNQGYVQNYPSPSYPPTYGMDYQQQPAQFQQPPPQYYPTK